MGLRSTESALHWTLFLACSELITQISVYLLRKRESIKVFNRRYLDRKDYYNNYDIYYSTRLFEIKVIIINSFFKSLVKIIKDALLINRT